MPATIADIIRIMETIAPVGLTEKWDNVGLQVGQKDWPVRSVWIALDPLPEVVSVACKHKVDLLITHHPLLFHPLKAIDFSTPVGSVIRLASLHKMAILAAHTNLDNAVDGMNDVLARKLELKNLKVLSGSAEAENCKLVVYVPVEYEHKVLDAIFETNAGEIGSYTCCSFRNNGQGTFKPGASSNPFIGKVDEVSQIDEIRIETIVQKNDLKRVIKHIRKNHPYETMAYDVYPLLSFGNRSDEQRSGLGRVGELDEKKELASFALFLKDKLGLQSVKVVGNPDLPVEKAAVCAGSGSSLMSDFFSSGAQVFVSGDLRYHDARAVEAANLGLIDIGHFASEHVIVEVLAERLNKILSETGVDVQVEACRLEKDPFVIV